MRVTVNGKTFDIEAACSVLEVLRRAQQFATRRESSDWRGPSCGMGVCQECLVSIDGVERLACITACCDGMQVVANG